MKSISSKFHKNLESITQSVLTLSIGFAENFIVAFEINGKPAVLEGKNRRR